MTLSNAISIMDAFRSRPDRPTDLWTSEVVVAHQSSLPATRKPILRALGKARRSAEGRMLSSVARRLVEEARRLLKHHSCGQGQSGPSGDFFLGCVGADAVARTQRPRYGGEALSAAACTELITRLLHEQCGRYVGAARAAATMSPWRRTAASSWRR